MTITADSTTLDGAACWRLLGTVEVGRLCYTESAMPVIRPVPFVVDGASVVVALSRAVITPAGFTRPTIVAFEAGEWVPSERRGWSVQLVGRALVMAEVDALRCAERGLTSWINGGPALYVQVSDGIVTGQRTVS
jgi:uncharacterized protein